MRKYKKWLVSFLLGTFLVTTSYGGTVIQNPVMQKESFINHLQTLEVNYKETAQIKGNLTREEAAVYLVKALGLSGVAKDYEEQKLFKDVTTHQGEINLVKTLGLMKGIGSETFGPKIGLSVSAAESILSRLEALIKADMQFEHAFYAISSSSQMALIKNYDAISFGWSEVIVDANKQISVVTDGIGDFKVPSGFEVPLDEAKANGVATYLMVYYEDQGGQIRELLNDSTQRAEMIRSLVNLTKKIEKDGVERGFDGLTIDFEQLRSEDLKAPYVTFLKELKIALAAEGKSLMVAVQPTTYFKGYDYKGIGEVADRVILMAHDYGAKSLNVNEQKQGIVMTPMTPIDEVYATLREATTAVADKSKLVLQISFASTQWQMKNQEVIHTFAYTPTYTQIETRLNTPGTVSYYDEIAQNPYAIYEADGVRNIIWYENTRSIEAKEDLAKLLGIRGISYWRLGTIPDSYLASINLY